MQKIKESYFNLILISSSVKQYWVAKVAVHSFLNTVVPDEIEMEEIISMPDIQKNFECQSYAIKCFIQIQTCAFLDEYSLLFSLPISDESKRAESIEFRKGIKTLLKPAITVINNYWKDLYEVRNTLLAHNWRKGKNSPAFMFTNATDSPPNVPWIDEEFTLLVGIFDGVLEILQQYAPDYFSELSEILATKSSQKVHHQTPVNNHEESMKLVSEINQLMTAELALLRLNAKS